MHLYNNISIFNIIYFKKKKKRNFNTPTFINYILLENFKKYIYIICYFVWNHDDKDGKKYIYINQYIISLI